MRKLIMTGLAVLILVNCVIGCGAASDQKTTRTRYSEDGYMGFSSANPGLLTSPNSRNYGNDTQLVNMALKGVRHIRRTSVLFRGGTALVRIRVERGLTDEQMNAIRMNAEKRLVFMLPRYTVRVRIYQ